MKKYSFNVVGLLSILLFVAFFFLLFNLKHLSIRKEYNLIVKEGDSINTIIQKLRNDNVIKSKRFVKLYSKIRNIIYNCDKVFIGEYDLSRQDNLSSLFDKICNGKTTMVSMTIQEGLYTSQVVEIINKNKDLSGDAIFFEKEGFLLPETYTFPKGYSRKDLLGKMYRDMDEFLSYEMRTMDDDLPLKSKYEILILASIVEAEAKTDEERPLIASVYINRLKKNMRLQADPTTIYEITQGKYKMSRLLTLKDLKKKGKWNTYMKLGLPETPICNPGKKSIQAVLHPAYTDYLYFVAKSDLSGHIFATNYNEHLNNKSAIKKSCNII